jgi:hypothetical protein
MDNRSVLVASTSVGASPTKLVRMWGKMEKKYTDVQQPKSISEYNTSMGIVDQIDRLISFYHVRTRKWPVQVFFHFNDLAIVNSWIEYGLDQKALGHRRKKQKASWTSWSSICALVSL